MAKIFMFWIALCKVVFPPNSPSKVMWLTHSRSIRIHSYTSPSSQWTIEIAFFTFLQQKEALNSVTLTFTASNVQTPVVINLLTGFYIF